MLGTYSSVDAPAATKTALKDLMVAKARAHGLDTAKQGLDTNPVNGTQATFENVPGHREVPENATDCPGSFFQAAVLRFMRSEMQSLAGPADAMPPADPSTVNATVSRRSAVLTWSASSGDTGTGGGGVSGVAGYDVLRATPGGTPVRIASTTGTTFTDNTRVQGAVYEYVVQTYDGASNRSGAA